MKIHGSRVNGKREQKIDRAAGVAKKWGEKDSLGWARKCVGGAKREVAWTSACGWDVLEATG